MNFCMPCFVDIDWRLFDCVVIHICSGFVSFPNGVRCSNEIVLYRHGPRRALSCVSRVPAFLIHNFTMSRSVVSEMSVIKLFFSLGYSSTAEIFHRRRSDRAIFRSSLTAIVHVHWSLPPSSIIRVFFPIWPIVSCHRAEVFERRVVMRLQMAYALNNFLSEVYDLSHFNIDLKTSWGDMRGSPSAASQSVRRDPEYSNFERHF